jgi:ApbE superfamily uncharacterized protein (UPF0280 family)
MSSSTTRAGGTASAGAGPVAATTPDGRRLHLQHGPIDLVIEAWGEPSAVAAAYRRAWERFRPLLDELVAELPALRRPFPAAGPHAPAEPASPVGRRMAEAVRPFAGDAFVTPMAAVAGAVADEVCAALVAAGTLRRAYVNDGGDIALFLMPGERLDVGLVPVPRRPTLAGKATIRAPDPVRGVATSGRHGRSFSLGIADAVTVLAADAARADAAATLIANAVDLPGHPAIRRVPVDELDPDSDLGGRLVTAEVGALAAGEVDRALVAGVAEAERMRARGLIVAAVLCLEGELRTVGRPDGASGRGPSGPVLASGGPDRAPLGRG